MAVIGKDLVEALVSGAGEMKRIGGAEKGVRWCDPIDGFDTGNQDFGDRKPAQCPRGRVGVELVEQCE